MAREGYYPDPSIPGYVRYWNGLSWVPGTSRPAAAVPAARSEETGPVFLDEPVAEPVVWQADPVHQAGFGGPRDRRVSWGSPEPRPGISLARPPAAEPLREDPELPPHRAREGAGPSPRGREGAGPSPQPPGFDLGGPVDAAASAQGPGFDAAAPGEAELRLGRGREGAGEFPQGAEHDHALPSDPWKRSAPEETPRRPHGPGATPAAPPAEVPPAPAWPGAAWPEAAGASMSGMTSSWPEAEPRREPAPPRADEPWPPRATGGRPVLPRPAEAAPSGPPRTDDAGPEAWSPRPAGTRPVLPRPAETTPSRADDAGPEA
ncbi:DUF2510 domain-containing protein, partial [Streptomyces sp. NPDC096339]|uniref:DUF2510 domain-containing protein n=1 Tax=Streptomyces sp. NPDC096339 TaxID=3366086 RepID=UPI003811EB90